MVRVSKLTGLLLLVAWATGCTATKSTQTMKSLKSDTMSVTQALKDAVHLTPKAAPATQMEFGWQKTLAQLPDPTKNGTMIPGLVGQVFIFTNTMQPAEITGELTVSATDTTVRPNGVTRQANVWHFTAETLKNLVVMDERFGKSWVLFLPWPEDWVDVKDVQLQARYDQPIGDTIYSQPAKIALEAVKISGNNNSIVPTAGMSVPDPAMLMKNSVPMNNNGGSGTSGTNAGRDAVARRSFDDGLGAGRLPTKVTALPNTPAGTAANRTMQAGGIPAPGSVVQQASSSVPMNRPSTNTAPTTAPTTAATNDTDFGRIVIPRGGR